MKKSLIYIVAPLLLLTSIVGRAYGQKLVIGSEVPNLKEVKWQGAAPPNGKAMLIEFYQESNPTSRGFFSKLAPVKSNNGEKVSIVVLTRDSGAPLEKLVASYGDNYYIGLDDTGNTFTNFGVKYLPYTMLVDSKSKILWIGNLGNLQQSSIDKIK